MSTKAHNRDFPWGTVVETILVNLDDGQPPEPVIKYETHNSQDPEKGLVTMYHVGTTPGNHTGSGYYTMSHAILAIIAKRNLGLNQHPLVEGVARALGLLNPQ